MELICIIFALGISIATAALASRKNRNPWNWFFLSLFWGIVGLIILACSKCLDRKNGERDTLVKVLWIVTLIPLVLFVVFFYDYTIDRRELQNSYQIEQRIQVPHEIKTDNYIEKKVDLNDYLNSSTGWDDNTDWNCTGFEDEESQKIFDRALEKNGIYWSDKKQSWVKKVKEL